MSVDIASALRAARRAAGLKQAELAGHLDLPARVVSSWERGEVPVPLGVHERLVAALGERDAVAAATLAAAFAADFAADVDGPFFDPPPAPEPGAEEGGTAPSSPLLSAVERGVFEMADELDIPMRPVRVALARLLRRLASADVSVGAAADEVEAWAARDREERRRRR